jgi:hypothetical protein
MFVKTSHIPYRAICMCISEESDICTNQGHTILRLLPDLEYTTMKQ